jgi:hypothetical protein
MMIAAVSLQLLGAIIITGSNPLHVAIRGRDQSICRRTRGDRMNG